MIRLLVLLVLSMLILTLGFQANAQQPLPTPNLRPINTPVLTQLLPPGAQPTPTNHPPTTVPPPVGPTVTPLWQAVYYVQNYTPLWTQPVLRYFVPFTLVPVGWYLTVQEEGYWLSIKSCTYPGRYVAACPYAGLYVQNDWNVVRR